MKPVLPGATIGILGGGQLGRMLALEGRHLGYKFACYDPSPSCPAAAVCDQEFSAPFSDLNAARLFADACDMVTLEWENVPAELVRAIAERKPVQPGASVLSTIQDRLVQRRFLESKGFPQTAFADGEGLDAAVSCIGYPCIVKTRRHGYDGKGQTRLTRAAELASARSLAAHGCIVEKLVVFEKELSVVVARTADGRTSAYAPGENAHRGGILFTTRAPAGVPAGVAKAAVTLATRVAEELGHVGVMGVELFWLGGEGEGRLLVNEIAPRVHNSGHHTLGGCKTSQFEQHLRAVCGLPLGDPALLGPALMINLLGDLWKDGEPKWERALQAGAKLFLYGKAEARPGRKMGHLLLLGEAALKTDPDSLLASLR